MTLIFNQHVGKKILSEKQVTLNKVLIKHDMIIHKLRKNVFLNTILVVLLYLTLILTQCLSTFFCLSAPLVKYINTWRHPKMLK